MHAHNMPPKLVRRNLEIQKENSDLASVIVSLSSKHGLNLHDLSSNIGRGNLVILSIHQGKGEEMR